MWIQNICIIMQKQNLLSLWPKTQDNTDLNWIDCFSYLKICIYINYLHIQVLNYNSLDTHYMATETWHQEEGDSFPPLFWGGGVAIKKIWTNCRHSIIGAQCWWTKFKIQRTPPPILKPRRGFFRVDVSSAPPRPQYLTKNTF